MRILTMICCVLAIVALYGCGGSSQFTEDAQLQNFLDSAVVRIGGVGNKPNVASTSMVKDNNFFSSDTFAGDGVITGESLNEAIDIDCAWSEPYLVDSDGDVISINGTDLNPLYDGALISVVDVSPATGYTLADCDGVPSRSLQAWGDIRNCCLVELVADGTPDAIDTEDSCSLDVDCVIDETQAGLNVTSIQFEMTLEEYMQTTMRDNTGAVAMAIEERAYPSNDPDNAVVDTNPADLSIMDLDGPEVFIYRDNCIDVPGSFVLNNDDLDWPSTYNTVSTWLVDSDASHDDKIWQVDSIGAVNYVSGSLADCSVQYFGLVGTVDLSPLASSQSVEEYIEILGAGMICNSQSETDCTPEYLYPDWDDTP